MSVAADQLAALLRVTLKQGDDDDVVPTSSVAIAYVPAVADDVPRMLQAIRG